ncbi:hypothetical protein HQ520_06420, partial [bacterium]|nr:hypothetical protein [bacterium]
MSRPDGVPVNLIHERSQAHCLLILSLLYAAAVFLWFEPWRGEDLLPVAHYGQVAAAVLDDNLDVMTTFLEAPVSLETSGRAAESLTREGYVSVRAGTGPGLLLSPFWLAGHLIAVWVDGPEADRFSPFYLWAWTLGALFYGYLGFLLLWRISCRLTTDGLAMVAALAVFFGSSAWMAALKGAEYPVLIQMFTVAFFLYTALGWARDPGLRAAVYTAVAAGLMVLTWWTSVTLLLVPIVSGLGMLVGQRVRRAGEAIPQPRDEPVRIPVETEYIVAEAEELLDDGVGIVEQTETVEEWRRIGILKLLLCGLIGLVVFVIMLTPQILVWWKTTEQWFVPPEFSGRGLPGRDLLLGLWDNWRDYFAGDEAGLFYRFPILILAALGLLVAALRRTAFGVGLFLAFLLFTLADSMPWRWQAGSGNASASLAAVFVIGMAVFCGEMRSRGTRFLMGAGLLTMALWNVGILILSNRTGQIVSPWPGAAGRSADLLPSMLAHPLAWFADSLLVRYMTQGPAPLGGLVFLLATVLAIPPVTWLLLRYGLPVARRWHILKLLALCLVGWVLIASAWIWQTRLSSGPRTGNMSLSRTIEGLLVSGTPAESELVAVKLRQIHEVYPGNLAAALRLANLERWLGHSDAARGLYADLAGQKYYAGYVGLSETAWEPEEELAALEELSRRSVGDVPLALRFVEAYLRLGERERARDWLDRVFPPQADYWL